METKEREIKKFSDDVYILYLPIGDERLAIGLLRREEGGGFGYWDYNCETGNKSWVEVNIPEQVEQIEGAKREIESWNEYCRLCDLFEQTYGPIEGENRAKFLPFIDEGVRLWAEKQSE